MIRVADYIAETLAGHGVRHVFMVTGGGAMHLNDSVGREPRIRYICSHHEQAAAMAAALWSSGLFVFAFGMRPAMAALPSDGRDAYLHELRPRRRAAPKVHETFIKRLEQNGKKEIVREVVSKVLNEAVGVRFEVEESPTAPVAAPTPLPRPAATEAPVVRPTVIAPPEPANTTVRLSDDIRSKLYQDEPLIRAVVDQLGGSIIKLEE